MNQYPPLLRSYRLFGGLLVSALLAGGASAAQTATPVPPAATGGYAKPQAIAANEYLPASALKPGMKGYGLTVFKGAKIERFNVTVLGLLKKVNNGGDLILVRLEGGPVTQRSANVIAGMSGSPVYINGRIVGAVAYAPVFAREPLGFLTPIEDMLEAWDPDLPQAPLAMPAPPPAGTASALAAPISVSGQSVRSVNFTGFGQMTEQAGQAALRGGVLTLQPLATPVSVAGVSLSRIPALASLLAPHGLTIAQVPGGAKLPANAAASPLQPGGAFGVSLATGDLDMTAIGTLTYRRGDKIVGFGHPFTGIGAIDAPMFSAYIHDVLPSFQSSQKLGSPVKLVGRVFQDRPFSVGGQVGAQPTMVPISVDIDDRTSKRSRKFRANVLRHPLLTPQIAGFATSNAIAELHGQPGDATATVTLEIEAEEVGKITRTNTFFDPVAIGDVATSDLQSLLRILSANPFYPVGVQSVKMNVVIEPRRDTAQVERIFVKQSRFEPGDTVDIGVVLKPYKKESVVRYVQVKIPQSAPAGPLALTVQGGGASGGTLSLPGGAILVRAPGGGDTTPSANLQQMVRRFTEREKNNELVARLILPTTAITVQGEKLTGLPPAIADVMRSTRSTGLRTERDEVKTVEGTEYVLSGAQSLTIRVAKKGQAAPEPAPAPAPDSTGGSVQPPPPGRTVSAYDDDMGEESASPLGIRPVMAAPALTAEEGDNLSPNAPAEAMASAAEAEETTTKPEPAAAPKKEPEAPARPAAPDAPKPVGRLPGLWQQVNATDFRAGTLNGVTVTSRGEVRLAPTLDKVAESNETYFWTMTPDGAGGVFAGTGDNGLIYRIAPDGKRTEFAKTGELQVHALARAADGTLYAGTSPNGRVLKIGADGKMTTLFTAKEKYVLALAVGPNGYLYAATGGGSGQIYRIAPDGKGETIYEGGESHITTLALDAKGNLYAGTAPGGLVLRMAADGSGRPVVLYDAAETSITGMAVAANGDVYAGTAPRGMLYRISANSTPRVMYDKAPGAIAGVQVAPDGTVWFASQSTVFALQADETVQTYDAPSDIQILSVLVDTFPSNGRQLWASTGNIGAVYALGGDGTPQKGTLLSSVFDAKTVARWGTLRWTANAPAGSRIVLETRSGDVAEPDDTWSAWSRGYGYAAGEPIASPQSRYLQYRATLEGGPSTLPQLDSVEVFYLTRNQAPTVAVSAPRGGEVWRGSKTIRWSGTDPDKDTLSYQVMISGDGGKTWQPVQAGRTSTAPAPPASPKPAPAAPAKPSAEERIRAELDRQVDIPGDVKEAFLRDAPPALREAMLRSSQIASAGQTPPAPVTPAPAGTATPPAATPASASAGTTRETSVTLDTTKYADGVYLLRVVASDAAANPQEPMTAERLSSEFRIANRPPVLVIFDKSTTVQPDRTVRLEGSVVHRQIAVRAVQYRVGNGDWVAAAAADGLFDSPMESFAITTSALAPGTHTIEVQAQDEAGNMATEKTKVTVR